MTFELFFKPETEGSDVVLWDPIALKRINLALLAQVLLDFIEVGLDAHKALALVFARLLEDDLVYVVNQDQHIYFRVLEWLHVGRLQCQVELRVD